MKKAKETNAIKIKAFQKKVWSYYEKEGRHTLPWRKTKDPYKILVSEMMLQQTQVDRVIPKYKAFLAAFPNIVSLAEASNADVLKLWSGLGYNRRALFLKRAAEAVVKDFKSKMPKDPETLETLPGIGPYTARAIATFSHNHSYTFIETNIRSVFISEFFPRVKTVSDKNIFPLIEATLPKEGMAREWYYALMDYGVHLKKTRPNPSRKSAQYAKQSAFKGSLREIRGGILKACLADPKLTRRKIVSGKNEAETERTLKVLTALEEEGFITVNSKGNISLKIS